MSIHKASKILINGSSNAFGGSVYSASFNHEYGNTPSSVSISIISKTKEYLPVKLSASVPYTISFGDELKLKLYAVNYSIEDGTDGRILKVDFIDGRFMMNRYWVTLADFPCTSPNIIKVSNRFLPSEAQLSLTVGPEGKPSVNLFGVQNVAPLSKPTNGNQIFQSYRYAQLRALSPIALPEIPNETQLYRLNSESTLGDIFSQFCRAYGFTWYWDYDNDVPILLDLRTDVDLDITLPDQLRGIECLKSTSFGESIRDLEAQGAVFFVDASEKDTKQPADSWAVANVLNIFDQKNFLDAKVFDKENIQLAIMAAWGEDVYENYLFNRYDLSDALAILGLDVIEDSRDAQNGISSSQLETITSQLFPNGNVPSYFTDTVRLIRARNSTKHNSAKDAHFRMAGALKAGQVGWFTSPYTVSSTAYQITEVNPETLVTEVPGIGAFLLSGPEPFSLTNYDTRNGKTLASATQVRDKTTDKLFVVTFPKLKFLFDNFGATSPNAQSPQNPDGTFPNSFPTDILGVRLLTDGHQIFPDSNPHDTFFIKWGNVSTFQPEPTVDGIVGAIGFDIPALANNNNSMLSTSYASKYKSAICGLPQLNDLVTSFRVVTLTNQSVLSPKDAVANTTILPNKTAKTFAVDIYGIETGLNLHPNKGLDSFRISMGDNGYESSYVMSSKKRIPLDNQIVRTIYL